MSSLTHISVPFHGTELFVIEHDGQPYTPMKPIVEGMGLAWQAQHRKLLDRFNSTVTEMVMVADDGKQRSMTCLPMRKLFGWLMSISPNKIPNPDTRARVITYQNECDDVLWDYWTKGQAHNPRHSTAHTTQHSASDHSQHIPRYAQSLTLPEMSQLTGQPISTVADYLAQYYQKHPQHTQHSLSREVQITLQQFWLGVGVLMGAVELNHSCSPDILAINLRHLYREAAKTNTALPPVQNMRQILRLSQSPLFWRYAAVQSKLWKKTVKAWQFQANPNHTPAVTFNQGHHHAV